VKDVAREGIGLERVVGVDLARVTFIAVFGRLCRLRVPEDPVADPVPYVTQILVAPGVRRLPPGALHEGVGCVVEEHVLVADDLLEHGRRTGPVPDVLAEAPADIVEEVVLVAAVQVIGHAEPGAARVLLGLVEGIRAIPVSPRIAGNVVEHIGEPALPRLDVAAVVPRPDAVGHLVLVDQDPDERAVPDIAADLGPAHVDPCMPRPCHHVARNLQRLRVAHVDRLPRTYAH